MPTYDFNTAMSLGENIPSKEQWEKLISGLSWTPISVGRNITGLLGVDKDGKYIFLQDGCYWTSTLFPAEPEAVFVVFVDSRRRREPEIIFINMFAEKNAVRALAGLTDPILNTFNPEKTF